MLRGLKARCEMLEGVMLLAGMLGLYCWILRAGERGWATRYHACRRTGPWDRGPVDV